MDIKQAMEEARLFALQELPIELTTEEFVIQILKGLKTNEWISVQNLGVLTKKHMKVGNSYVHLTTIIKKLLSKGEILKEKRAGKAYVQWSDYSGARTPES